MSETVRKREPGWWYPFIYVGAFVPVLLVNAYFIYSAVHSFTGVEKGAYEKGLAYNDVLAKAREQQELGWSMQSRLSPDGSGHAQQVQLRFDDRNGTAIKGLSVTVEFYRPTQEGHDVSITLKDDGTGHYAGTAVLALAGQWDMRVLASKQGASFQSARRVLIP